jgi:hypothetical protein
MWINVLAPHVGCSKFSVSGDQLGLHGQMKLNKNQMKRQIVEETAESPRLKQSLRSRSSGARRIYPSRN